MKTTAADSDEDGIKHPRQSSVLFGHGDAEQALLEAYRSGRIPHAWLIGGPPGIGKATLAFRMARFVLAHPDPAADVVQRATSLAVPPENPAAGLITAQSHPDLLILERTVGDTGKLRSVIRVRMRARSRCSLVRLQASADGALSLSTRLMISMPRARMRCSKDLRSRRHERCFFLSVMRPAPSCRPSAHAVTG